MWLFLSEIWYIGTRIKTVKMEFNTLVNIIFRAVPEFELSLNEKLTSDYYNSFLGDFALFTKKAIKDNADHATHCLKLIDGLINDNLANKEFINMMVINVLEILTDSQASQRAAVKYFTGTCLSMFTELINTHFVNLLDK